MRAQLIPIPNYNHQEADPFQYTTSLTLPYLVIN